MLQAPKSIKSNNKQLDKPYTKPSKITLQVMNYVFQVYYHLHASNPSVHVIFTTAGSCTKVSKVVGK